MKIIFMNGAFYPLAPYVSLVHEELGGFVFIQENWWTEKKALQLASEINEEVALCGFSRGATYALTVAHHCPLVKEVVAHSPFYLPMEFKRYFKLTVIHRECDKTPCRKGSVRVFKEYEALGYDVQNIIFPPQNLKSLNWVEYFSRKLGHYFP